MKCSTFYVEKTSDTFADTLLAIGLAALCQEVLKYGSASPSPVVLRNKGSCFEIELTECIDDELLSHWRHNTSFLLFLQSSKQVGKFQKKGKTFHDGFDYERKKQERDAYLQKLKKVSPQWRTPRGRKKYAQELHDLIGDPPDADLDLYIAINHMKAADTYNELIMSWQELTQEQQKECLEMFLGVFQKPVNDVEAMEAQWSEMAKRHVLTAKARVSALQLLNPTKGKGANATKGNKLSIGGLEHFWFIEFLKFKGWFLIAAPYLIKGSKDRKTYVPVPETIELTLLCNLVRDFRSICWSTTAVKLDVMASLRFTEVLIAHHKAGYESDRHQEAWDSVLIISMTSGLGVAAYKEMGNAFAIMNVSSIHFPDWFPSLSDRDTTDEAFDFVQEQISLLHGIRGHEGKEGDEEHRLFSAYRDFLSSHNLAELWNFTTLYSGYLLSKRHKEKQVQSSIHQCSIQGLDYLVMNTSTRNPDVKKIIQNPGFRRIANAIRCSTVTPQRNALQRNQPYEIRYGLGQELVQNAQSKAGFLDAFMEFIHVYNAETARVEEKLLKKLGRSLEIADYREYHLRSSVSEDDLDDVLPLLDEVAPVTLAKMLVGYGYAKRSYQPAEGASNQDTTKVENEINV